MCDSFWPVGSVSTTVFVRGSITLIELRDLRRHVEPAVRPEHGAVRPLRRRRSRSVATRRREAMSITSSVRPSEPGRPTPESP